MVKNQDLLPIGSVVLLNEGKKRLMIFGIKQVAADSKGVLKEYDYCAVLYPEGNINTDSQVLFNQEDIASVYFRGYNDDERKDFIEALDTSEKILKEASENGKENND